MAANYTVLSPKANSFFLNHILPPPFNDNNHLSNLPLSTTSIPFNYRQLLIIHDIQSLLFLERLPNLPNLLLSDQNLSFLFPFKRTPTPPLSYQQLWRWHLSKRRSQRSI